MSPNDSQASTVAPAAPTKPETASNVGNPSRAAQVAAGDKATAPKVIPKGAPSTEGHPAKR
jgi:hypothetical protein